MQRATSKAWLRFAAPRFRRGDQVLRRPSGDEPLTCVLGFAAAGLFASCLALLIQHEIAPLAVLEFALVCAAPPLAALAGLFVGRRR